MTRGPRITYAPRPDATPQGELNALATVYAFLLNRKESAGPDPEPDSRDAAPVKNKGR